MASILVRFVAIGVRYYTDPGCSWSWSAEPSMRRLMVEFGDDLRWTYVMGGLARDYGGAHDDPDLGAGDYSDIYLRLMRHWLDVADEGRMPIDPRLWSEAPITSTYPACMAVKAAAEQATDRGHAYLRALREGLMCFRRKLDTPQALTEEARSIGLDVHRFRISLGSSATVEAFGADLDATRAVPQAARDQGKVRSIEGGERLAFPSLEFVAEDGARHGVYGYRPYGAYVAAATAAGARPSGAPRPSVLEALERFGRMGLPEVEAVCGLPGPVAAAELWKLAASWQAKPVRVLTDHLWEPA